MKRIKLPLVAALIVGLFGGYAIGQTNRLEITRPVAQEWASDADLIQPDSRGWSVRVSKSDLAVILMRYHCSQNPNHQDCLPVPAAPAAETTTTPGAPPGASNIPSSTTEPTPVSPDGPNEGTTTNTAPSTAAADTSTTTTTTTPAPTTTTKPAWKPLVYWKPESEQNSVSFRLANPSTDATDEFFWIRVNHGFPTAITRASTDFPCYPRTTTCEGEAVDAQVDIAKGTSSVWYYGYDGGNADAALDPEYEPPAEPARLALPEIRFSLEDEWITVDETDIETVGFALEYEVPDGWAAVWKWKGSTYSAETGRYWAPQSYQQTRESGHYATGFTVRKEFQGDYHDVEGCVRVMLREVIDRDWRATYKPWTPRTVLGDGCFGFHQIELDGSITGGVSNTTPRGWITRDG